MTGNEYSKRRITWLSTLAGAIVATLVVAIWLVLSKRELVDVDIRTAAAAHLADVLIKHDIESRIASLTRLARRWEIAGGLPRRQWEADVTNYIADQPGYQAIIWIDSTLHVRWITPFEGNGAALNVDVTRQEETRRAVMAARDKRTATLTQAFERLDGINGFGVVAPVFPQDRFDGLMGAIFRTHEWLHTVLTDLDQSDFLVRVFINEQQVYPLPVDNDPPGAKWMHYGGSATHGFEWTTRVSPRAEFLAVVHSRFSTVVLILGLLLSVLMAMAVYAALLSRRRANQLVRAQAYAQAIVDAAMEAVISFDSNGRIESFNQAAQNMYGYTFAEIVGKSGELLMADDVLEEYNRYLQQKPEIDASAFYFDVQGRDLNAKRKDNSIFPIHLSISEMRFQNEPKFVALVRDMSAQKAAEREARQNREQLAHVERLNTLGEMATGIAHEINQPLSAISMYAQSGLRFLDGKTAKPERVRVALEKLSVQAHRAGAVIERIQQLSKQRGSQREAVDCNSLIKEIGKLAEGEAHIRDLEIEVEPATEALSVLCDPIQIQQVALNLLRNGMESMVSSGCQNGKRIKLTACHADNDVKISIIDSGSGISDAVAEQLFEPFSSTKATGMGMGLSISRAIINAHGGQLGFTNNAQGGATFTFTLPYAQPET